MTASEIHEPARLNTDAVYRRLHSDEDWAHSVELPMNGTSCPVRDASSGVLGLVVALWSGDEAVQVGQVGPSFSTSR